MPTSSHHVLALRNPRVSQPPSPQTNNTESSFHSIIYLLSLIHLQIPSSLSFPPPQVFFFFVFLMQSPISPKINPTSPRLPEIPKIPLLIPPSTASFIIILFYHGQCRSDRSDMCKCIYLDLYVSKMSYITNFNVLRNGKRQ